MFRDMQVAHVFNSCNLMSRPLAREVLFLSDPSVALFELGQKSDFVSVVFMLRGGEGHLVLLSAIVGLAVDAPFWPCVICWHASSTAWVALSHVKVL